MIDWSNYPHFTADEFACKCGCGTNEIREELVASMQALRTKYGKPIYVSSGYRCPAHPIEARKKTPGTHSLGLACDVLVAGRDAHSLLTAASQMDVFTGIGVNQKGAGRFIHLDVVSDNPHFSRPTVWSY